jgi:glyoxalase family protein
MSYDILGLHHVTATVGHAQADLEFFREVLGLRLVKRTVNFDNHHVYHFYYGDERGTPGSIWTTFPYAGRGIPPGRHGEGQITSTTFSVPPGSLELWRSRLQEKGVPVDAAERSSSRESVSFSDSSGLRLELREIADDDRVPWTAAGIGGDAAIRGLDRVTLTVMAPDPTVELLTDLLGFHVVEEAERRVSLAVGAGMAGQRVDLVHSSAAAPARNGLGTVHHVAFAIATSEEQEQLQQELLRLGVAVTEILDRQYFQSIYFREPGGVLLEVATMGPGFTIDEPLADLGRDLKLPPWEEPNRADIVRELPAITA